MKIGVVYHPSNFTDWERYFAKAEGAPEVSDAAIWDEVIPLIEAADEFGYDKLWVTEHHGSPFAFSPNPLTFLTFCAGRTRNVGVGSQVVVIPWWKNPVRAAEEIAMLDNFLQGRELTVGFGRGVAKHEFEMMSVDRDESRGRFSEGVQIVQGVLANEYFSFEGEYFQLEDVNVRPRPRDAAGLLERMCAAFGSPESLEIVTRLGLGMLIVTGKPFNLITEDLVKVNGIRAEMGLEPSQPTIQVIAYCGENQAEAERAGLDHFANFAKETEYNYGWSKPENFAGVKGYEGYHALASSGEKVQFVNADFLLFAGTPENIADRLIETQKETGAKEFILNFQMTGMPADEAHKSMKLFAEEGLPALHEHVPTLELPSEVA